MQVEALMTTHVESTTSDTACPDMPVSCTKDELAEACGHNMAADSLEHTAAVGLFLSHPATRELRVRNLVGTASLTALRKHLSDSVVLARLTHAYGASAQPHCTPASTKDTGGGRGSYL